MKKICNLVILFGWEKHLEYIEYTNTYIYEYNQMMTPNNNTLILIFEV